MASSMVEGRAKALHLGLDQGFWLRSSALPLGHRIPRRTSRRISTSTVPARGRDHVAR